MTKTPTAALADFLDQRAIAVREIEAEAEIIIHEQKDQAAYAAKMREKAELLAALAKDAKKVSPPLPSPLSRNVGDKLGGFSQNASNALGIGSVFYMSALLYPDSYAPGQPNDLEAYAAEVRSWG